MRRYTSIAFGLIFTILALSPLQAAQEKIETEESDLQAVQPILPDPEKVLGKLVGNWTYTAKWWDSPDSEPSTWDGKFKAGWVLDKRYVEFRAKADQHERDYKGLGYMGYDPTTAEYYHVWMDTTGTGMWISTGSYNAAKNSITDKGRYSDPVKGERKPYKGVTTFIDGDNMKYEFIIKDRLGYDFRQMEILYKRVK